MNNYYYFIPLINLGPPIGYKIIQEIPLLGISKIISSDNAKFEIIRRIITENKLILEKKEKLEYSKNKWLNTEPAFFSWENNKFNNRYSFIETQINMLEGEGLTTSSVPSFYVNYVNNNKKNFLSCSYEKYGNPRVIMQRKEFDMWIDGYPAININKKSNTTYSLYIINPYNSIFAANLEISDFSIKKNVKVNPRSVKEINFFDLIKKDKWTGQFYLYGKRRGILFLMCHDFVNKNNITTLEHSDPFRAELTYKPTAQHIRNELHKRLKEKFL